MLFPLFLILFLIQFFNKFLIKFLLIVVTYYWPWYQSKILMLFFISLYKTRIRNSRKGSYANKSKTILNVNLIYSSQLLLRPLWRLLVGSAWTTQRKRLRKSRESRDHSVEYIVTYQTVFLNDQYFFNISSFFFLF